MRVIKGYMITRNVGNDILHSPKAYALVIVDPPSDTKGQIRRFKQAAARIADSRWEIPPPE
jgi:hypothetical protein